MNKQSIMLADALFSKVRQRVLGLLYGNSGKDFYTNEIIRMTQMGSGVVQRELVSLTNMGLLISSVVGNQKHYQANQLSPLYNELRSIVLKTFGVAEVLGKQLIPMSQNIIIAFIYGSIAKQSDTPKSDIDVLLIGNDLIYADFFALFVETETQLGRKIHPTFYSPEEWKKKINANNHFIKKIIEQPKIFLIGRENDLSEL